MSDLPKADTFICSFESLTLGQILCALPPELEPWCKGCHIYRELTWQFHFIVTLTGRLISSVVNGVGHPFSSPGSQCREVSLMKAGDPSENSCVHFGLIAEIWNKMFASWLPACRGPLAAHWEVWGEQVYHFNFRVVWTDWLVRSRLTLAKHTDSDGHQNTWLNTGETRSCWVHQKAYSLSRWLTWEAGVSPVGTW